jgi:hypothetical protein
MNRPQVTERNSLKILMILLALGAACFAEDKALPIAIDCTFYGNVDFKKLRFPGYSNTKVAPEDIVFWRPERLPRSDRPHFQPSFWELGKGFGHIVGTVDWREIASRLRRLASDHGANVIAYQISGTEIRVRFLRATDNIYKGLLGQKDMKPSQ